MKRHLSPFLFLLLAAPLAAQTRAGGEFQVNTYFTGSQAYPSVALGPGGEFVVTWESGASQDGSDFGIFARRYDAAGQPRGDAFLVNSITANAQFMPSVFSDPRGGFVVAWSSFIGSVLRIEAQRFGPGGQRIGVEFQVSSGAASYEDSPVMAFDRSGNFVVAWMASPLDGSRRGIFARRFDASGFPRGGQFQVNTSTLGDQTWPAVAATPSGGFVVAWSSNGDAGGPLGGFGQRFDASGQRLGGEFALAPGGGLGVRPSMVTAPEGGFVAAWMDGDGNGDGVLARRFDGQGNPQGPAFVVNQDTANQQFFPWATGNTSGDFTVAWTSYTPAAAGFDMKAARFDASGQRRGSDFLVNTYTQGDQYVNRYAPTLASDPAGNFVVVWTSLGQDGSSYGVFGQRYGGLVPAGSSVDTGAGHNLVLEPGETVDVRPSWRNVNGAAQTFTGTLTQLTGPAGAAYTITDGSAAYGTVANGATGPCTDCYAVGVSAPAARPATHWDATAVEKIAPDGQGQVKRWPLHVGGSFTDVPPSGPFYRFVETLLHDGVTAGCSASTFCPGSATTREQMAAFVLVALEGAAYLPPPCSGPRFVDVPTASPFCRWIEDLFQRGVVSGCDATHFCPGDPVTREQMSVFLLRTLDPALDPPACSPPNTFADVPETSAFCRWVEELARRGITGGCGGGNYCPAAAVTREQMSAFLSTAFGLALYGM